MNTYATDGTFQLYNPMRRLLDGQVIGKDFPFFHGVGIPLLHFPLFYLLGHNVFAADATKWLMSPLIFLVTTFIFYLAFFRKIDRDLIATTLLTIVALICIDVVWPGNSLIGIRTTFPIITAAFMLWRPNFALSIKQYKVSLYYPAVFMLLGLSVSCGTEQGLSAIVAYILVELIRAIKSNSSIRQWWWRMSLKVLGIVLVTYVILSALTIGHANDALSYALIDIPKDQGWYFGAPPNNFLAWNTLSYFFNKTVLFHIAPVVIAGVVALGIGIWRKLISRHELYVSSFLVIYGSVVFCTSITGYWAPEMQLIPLTRVFGLIAVAVFVRIGFRNISSNKRGVQSIFRWTPAVICLFLAAIFGWFTFQTIKQVVLFDIKHISEQVKDARQAPDGTYVSQYWKKRIQAFAPYIPSGAKVWSTYTGIYDSMRNQLNGSTNGEDYIIHALGPERREQYVNDFINQKPDFVITLRPSYSYYEEWLWDRNWPFYRQLVTNYKIITDNDSHVLWQRQNNPRPVSSQASIINRNSDGTYTISPGTSDYIRLYEVTVDYSTISRIPLTASLPRYLLTPIGTSTQRFPIALPPYETSWQFPIILTPNDSSVTLTPSVQGIVLKSHLNISSISYREIPIDTINSYIYYDNYCSFGGNLSYIEEGSQQYNLRCTMDHLNLKYFESRPVGGVL